MTSVLEQLKKDYNPHNIAKYFYDISQIPRNSGDEEQISNFLLQWAKDHNLDVLQDQSLNIIIRKPATKGYEKEPTLILQGHMDMVCQKTPTSKHNFEKDPLKLYIDGDFLKAKDTTLGADDGVSMAYGLAVLAATDLSHPPLEVVFTVSEETSFKGVENLDYNQFRGRRLINLDSCSENRITVSSAGGISFTIQENFEREPIKKGYIPYRLEISGLTGGHSGEDIHKKRANAIILLGEILYTIHRSMIFEWCQVISIDGGNASNAIPREVVVNLLVKPDSIDKLNVMISDLISTYYRQFNETETNMKITWFPLKEIPFNKGAIAYKYFIDLIMTLVSIPQGVVKMHPTIEDFVEASSSLGIIKTEENIITMVGEIRSARQEDKEEIFSQILNLSHHLDSISAIKTMTYPGWEYQEISSFRDAAQEAFKAVYGHPAELEMIHAGLECSYFTERIPGMDCISIGPNNYDLHTPQEHLNLNSFVKIWKVLVHLLRIKSH